MRYFSKSLAGSVAALALMAGTASAQAVSCGGVGDGASWIAGDMAASDIATSGGPLVLSGAQVPQDGSLVTLFSASVAGTYRIEAQPYPGGDSVIEVYDATGGLVVIDDDSGGGLASRAEAELAAGDYCLLTRGFAGGGLDADLSVGRLEHEAITAGLSGGFFGDDAGPVFVGLDPCTAATPAVPIGAGPLDDALAGQGGMGTGSIADIPYWRFTLASPQAISIRAENENADPYIYVFDGQGALLAENDDYDSLNSRIDFTQPLPAGDYCIGMRALWDDSVPVTVRVLGYDPAAALAELYASGEAAPPLDGSFPITALGTLPGLSVRDQQIAGTTATWFSLEVPEAGGLLIDAVEVTDSDPVIILFDHLGNEIAFNDDANGTLNSQIVTRVTPGTYLLSVRQYADGYQGVIRLAIERFVRAQ